MVGALAAVANASTGYIIVAALGLGIPLAIFGMIYDALLDAGKLNFGYAAPTALYGTLTFPIARLAAGAPADGDLRAGDHFATGIRGAVFPRVPGDHGFRLRHRLLDDPRPDNRVERLARLQKASQRRGQPTQDRRKARMSAPLSLGVLLDVQDRRPGFVAERTGCYDVSDVADSVKGR